LGGWWSNRQPEVLWERRCEFSSWAHMSVPFASIRSWFCPGRTCGGGEPRGWRYPYRLRPCHTAVGCQSPYHTVVGGLGPLVGRLLLPTVGGDPKRRMARLLASLAAV
jgi:hypothetical protein